MIHHVVGHSKHKSITDLVVKLVKASDAECPLTQAKTGANFMHLLASRGHLLAVESVLHASGGEGFVNI